MGFRARVREKLSTTGLRRNSTLNSEATSTKTTSLGRTRTNSNASIPEHLRHTRSIPASLKSLFTAHSRANTETSTLGHRSSTLGAPSTFEQNSDGSSMETEPSNPGATPTQETAEKTGAALPRQEHEAGAKAQSHRAGQQSEGAEAAQKPSEKQTEKFYPESKGGLSQHPANVEHSDLSKPAESSSAPALPLVARPDGTVACSPVRSQPQEAHAYPPETPAGAPPAVPPRTIESTKNKDAKPEERSRGLDVDNKDLAPSSGFRMKLKLAWMGLKTKAKL